jgi:hypothetical protein
MPHQVIGTMLIKQTQSTPILLLLLLFLWTRRIRSTIKSRSMNSYFVAGLECASMS